MIYRKYGLIFVSAAVSITGALYVYDTSHKRVRAEDLAELTGAVVERSVALLYGDAAYTNASHYASETVPNPPAEISVSHRLSYEQALRGIAGWRDLAVYGQQAGETAGWFARGADGIGDGSVIATAEVAYDTDAAGRITDRPVSVMAPADLQVLSRRAVPLSVASSVMGPPTNSVLLTATNTDSTLWRLGLSDTWPTLWDIILRRRIDRPYGLRLDASRRIYAGDIGDCLAILSSASRRYINVSPQQIETDGTLGSVQVRGRAQIDNAGSVIAAASWLRSHRQLSQSTDDGYPIGTIATVDLRIDPGGSGSLETRGRRMVWRTAWPCAQALRERRVERLQVYAVILCHYTAESFGASRDIRPDYWRAHDAGLGYGYCRPPAYSGQPGNSCAVHYPDRYVVTRLLDVTSPTRPQTVSIDTADFNAPEPVPFSASAGGYYALRFTVSHIVSVADFAIVHTGLQRPPNPPYMPPWAGGVDQ